VVHDLGDPWFSEIVRGVNAAASESGLLTIVCDSARDPELELRYVDMLHGIRVNVVLFAGGGIDDPDYERRIRESVGRLTRQNGIVVAIQPRKEKWPTEIPDNFGGAKAMTEYLIGLGHRQIAMIQGPDRITSGESRSAGYKVAMEENGLKPFLVSAEFTKEGGACGVRELLSRGYSSTAIFAATDAMALGALSELHAQRINVPEDISVVGFDDLPGADYAAPPLTTMRVDIAALGYAGGRRALDLLSGEAKPQKRVHVHSVKLVERASAAPPKHRE
jgi:LacI family transcriptional regulator